MKNQKKSARFSFFTSFIFVILLSASTIFAAAGDIDPTFNASAYHPVYGSVGVFKEQPDGKILIGGGFTVINGVARSGIARLNADGTLDMTFNPPDFFNGLGLGRGVYSIGIQSDGKIIVGGLLFGTSNNYAPGLRRLNPDGSLDTSFIIQPLPSNASIIDIEILPDDKIVIGGSFQLPNISNLARLNADGSLDNAFSGNFSLPVNDLELLSGGKLVVGGGASSTGFFTKLNNDGTPDPSFSPVALNNPVQKIKVQPDGKILIAGAFTSGSGFQAGRLARLLSDGSIDTTFNLNLLGANSTIYDIYLGTDGKIAITGAFSAYNGVAIERAALLNTDGSLDTSFNPAPRNIHTGYAIKRLPDGKFLIGYYGIESAGLIRLNIDGTIDAAAPYSIGIDSSVRQIIQQPDNKIIVAGDFIAANGSTLYHIARFNPDGTLDISFIPNLGAINPTFRRITALALQADGKILVGFNSSINAYTLARLNPDGSRDFGFQPNLGSSITAINDIEVQSDQKILVGGSFSLPIKNLTRLNPDGSVDNGFGALPNGSVKRIHAASDGKIWIAGNFTEIPPFFRGRIAKLNSNGSVDGSFNPPGGANNSINDFDIQTDGKIVVGGAFTSLNGNNLQKFAGRFNADGSLDNSFAANIDWEIYAVKAQPNGKILIGGSVLNTPLSLPRKGLERLNSNGSTDTGFNIGTGANDNVYDIALQSDGKILAGGRFTRINGQSKLGIVRLLDDSVNTARTPFDFDGDGKADVSVFRPSENKWYILRSSDFGVDQPVFAVGGDRPIPSDYDGDGKTDVAIFRPSSGDWWYRSSFNNAYIFSHWGNSADISLPSDFDGDGRADYIVFRSSSNTWYRASSANGVESNKSFGLAGDKPVIGDFDGDGKSDVAIYRPSTGTWWYQASSNNAQIATQFGIATDVPVPADYDGDGTTDFAVYRPATGGWYILNSSTGQATIAGFGLAEDKPVPADYDGDGRADIAVFRPSTGVWYLLRTTDGFGALQFGVSTDIALPNAFIQ